MTVLDKLCEFANELSERASHGVTMPAPCDANSGAPIGPTAETERLYEIAYEIEAENAKLRELVRLMVERDALLICGHGCTPSTCKAYGSDLCVRIARLSDELGIEVDG